MRAAGIEGCSFQDYVGSVVIDWPAKRLDERLALYYGMEWGVLLKKPGFGQAKLERLFQTMLAIATHLGFESPGPGKEAETLDSQLHPTPSDILTDHLGLPADFPVTAGFFSERVLDFCSTKGLRAVVDLAQFATFRDWREIALSHENFGKKSLAEIERFSSALGRMDKAGLQEFLPIQGEGCGVDLGLLASKVANTHSSVGLDGLMKRLVHGSTLDETASEKRLTRERVRQVETQFLNSFQRVLSAVAPLRMQLWHEWAELGMVVSVSAEHGDEASRLAVAAVERLFAESEEGIALLGERDARCEAKFFALCDEPMFYLGDLVLADCPALGLSAIEVRHLLAWNGRTRAFLFHEESGKAEASTWRPKEIVAALLKSGVTDAASVLDFLGKLKSPVAWDAAQLRRSYLRWRMNSDFPTIELSFHARFEQSERALEGDVTLSPRSRADVEQQKVSRDVAGPESSDTLNAARHCRPTVSDQPPSALPIADIECLRALDGTLRGILSEGPNQRPSLGLLRVEESLRAEAIGSIRMAVANTYDRLLDCLREVPCLTSYVLAAGPADLKEGEDFFEKLEDYLEVSVPHAQRADMAEGFTQACRRFGLPPPGLTKDSTGPVVSGVDASSMSSSWRFTPKMKDEKTRNPVSGEFFAQDAIRNAGEALVREAIQNALDARVDRRNGKARVRIYISGPSTALSPATHCKWFGTAWRHYLAPRNGLRPGRISESSPCGYLAFEDFGTSGLTGDWEQADIVEGVHNPFFYFFRAEGATEKSSDQLGRWGIGKQVFPRSSNAQTLFGYSVTRDHPEGFLLGSCILKYHEVDGRVYRPDGYFGTTLDVGEGQEISVPTQDKDLLESFRADFNLRRVAGANGLSVVVPWLDFDEDGASGFNRESLLAAILDGYFLPILEGKLEVELEDEHGSIRIKSDNFRQVLEELVGSANRDDERRVRSVRRTKALVDLATASKTDSPLVFELAPCSAAKATWSDQMLPEHSARAIRTALTEGRAVKVKASLTIRPKIGESVQDVFWCVLRKEHGLNERPCYIREDLNISNVSSPRTNGFAVIVRIDKGPLAALLGDAENPAHTEWLPSSQNFKDKYVLGGVIIKFVSEFASELLRRVFSSTSQLDKDILRSLFYVPSPETQEEEGSPQSSNKGKNDDSPLPPVIDIEPSRRSISITPLKSGFSVGASGWDLAQGSSIEILAAYETSKGNALKVYRPYDFDFSGKSLKPSLAGCTIQKAEGNMLVVEVNAPEFSVTVTGFDVNRDLVVRARPLRVQEIN